MLNFTNHMKRISYLAERTLIHVHDEWFDPALDCLMEISANLNEAVQQLDELILTVKQSHVLAEEITE